MATRRVPAGNGESAKRATRKSLSGRGPSNELGKLPLPFAAILSTEGRLWRPPGSPGESPPHRYRQRPLDRFPMHNPPSVPVMGLIRSQPGNQCARQAPTSSSVAEVPASRGCISMTASTSERPSRPRLRPGFRVQAERNVDDLPRIFSGTPGPGRQRSTR